MDIYYDLQNLKYDTEKLNGIFNIFYDAISNNERFSEINDFYEMINLIKNKYIKIEKIFSKISGWLIEDASFENLENLLFCTKSLIKILESILKNKNTDLADEDIMEFCNIVYKNIKDINTNTKLLKYIKYPTENLEN